MRAAPLLWTKANLEARVSRRMGRETGLEEKSVRPAYLIWTVIVQALEDKEAAWVPGLDESCC